MYVLRSCSVATLFFALRNPGGGEGRKYSVAGSEFAITTTTTLCSAQHCMEGMGEEKLYFPLLKSEKRQKAPLGRSFSTHFVADCRSKKVNLLVPKL